MLAGRAWRRAGRHPVPNQPGSNMTGVATALTERAAAKDSSRI